MIVRPSAEFILLVCFCFVFFFFTSRVLKITSTEVIASTSVHTLYVQGFFTHFSRYKRCLWVASDQLALHFNVEIKAEIYIQVPQSWRTKPEQQIPCYRSGIFLLRARQAVWEVSICSWVMVHWDCRRADEQTQQPVTSEERRAPCVQQRVPKRFVGQCFSSCATWP